MITIRTAELLSTATVAKRLNVSTRRVLQLVEEQVLSAVKLSDGSQNIFTAEAVAAAVRARASKAGTTN